MIDAMIKSAILFAIVAIATRLLKRRSPASLRHLLWAFAIVGALSIPILSRVAPFEIAVLPMSASPSPSSSLTTPSERRSEQSIDNAAPSTPTVDSRGDRLLPHEPASTSASTPAPAPTSWLAGLPWMTLVATLWAIGAAVLLARLLIGVVIVRRIAARGQDVTDAGWRADIDRAILASGVRQPVEVRFSEETPVPYTCGLTHPTIVLPTSANEWNAERRDAVLLHELAHISRGDLAMNILSHVMRAMYWPNPLAWMAANGLRFEGERACDDAVLSAGARASDYADHLLDIVRTAGRPIPKVALAMARSSDFEGRLLAILEPGVPRARPGRMRTAVIATMFAAAILPLSALTSASAAAPVADMSASANAPSPETPESTHAPVSENQAIPQEAKVESPAKPVNTEPLPPASATVAALASALTDANASVRLAAVNSLGGLQDPAAIAALARAMKEDTDARVREAAAWALGEIDDTRAVPHLLEALKTERVAKVRVKIVESLGHIDDPSALPGVINALKDGNVEVRRAAVETVSEFEDQSATAALISMIRDEDVEVRRGVANALGSLEDPSAIDALTAMARDSDSEVRANAIEALSDFENQRLIPIFVTALKDSNAHVREHAADALGNFDELRKAPRELIDLLADPVRDVRRSAASSLGNIGDEAAVPALKKMVSDTDAETRRTAVEAMKDIGGAEAMQALLGLLKDPDPEIRKLAAEALGRKR